MKSVRLVVYACALLIVTWLSACSVMGGERCRGITLETSPSSLPLGGAAPLPTNSFQRSEQFILGTGELECCVPNHLFSATGKADCSVVDCEALRDRLTVAKVLGEFVDEPCGPWVDPVTPPQGVGNCNVYLDGDTIIGVRATCLD